MMTSVVVSPPPPTLLQARVEALERQRHACPTSQDGVIEVDESMRRARSAVEEAGLYSAVWTWVPPDYYTKWSLQQRADYLNVPNANVDYLCKSLLLENKKVLQNDDDSSPMDRTNPKYIMVVLQYAATLDVKKLVTAIRALRPNVRERLDENAFDWRVASPYDNAILTGYEHNSVTPFGLLQPQRILVVLSQQVLPLRRFWMGGGHVNLKLSLTVSDFINSPLHPVVADISNPRTGLDLKSLDAMADFSAVAQPPNAQSSSCGSGGHNAGGGAGAGGAGAPAPGGGGSDGTSSTTPLLANQQPGDTAAGVAAVSDTEKPIKEKKHKKRSDKDKKKKHRSKKDSTRSSSCSASQTSEESSKERQVGEGYIVHLQWDDHDNIIDDQSAITSPAFKVKKSKKDKDKSKKKSKKHRSKTILEEEGGEGEGGVIVEGSATTSGSNNDQSSEPSSSQAATESSPKSSKSSPLSAKPSKDYPHPMTLPTLPDNNNFDEEDSPGKMHRFQSVGATAPALPVAPLVPDVKAHKPKMKSRAMTSDLQAIMKRRREMAETLSSDNAPTAALLDATTSTKTKKNLGGGGASSLNIRKKLSGMTSDLQAIMARRRRLAGDADEDDVPNGN